jgi:hypothetical protein
VRKRDADAELSQLVQDLQRRFVEAPGGRAIEIINRPLQAGE